MKNIYTLVFAAFCLSYFSGLVHGQVSGSWKVTGTVTERESRDLVNLHAQSYFWADAALNGSEFRFFPDGVCTYTFSGAPQKARYVREGNVFRFIFENPEGKESSSEFSFREISRDSFELLAEDPKYSVKLLFYK